MKAGEGSFYIAWSHGRCPCCGGELAESVNGVPCRAIGEGVMMCGRCIENEHGRESDQFVPALLESIAARTDEPMDRLLDEIDREVARTATGFSTRRYLAAVNAYPPQGRVRET